MNTTNNGGIPSNVGFPNRMSEGREVNRARTRQHTPEEVGQTFEDNFGRTYVYTLTGCIY